MTDIENAEGLRGLTAEIVSAYLGRNPIAVNDIGGLIHGVHTALRDCGQEKSALVPAVPIGKSITPDAIICLEDGKRLKMLKRHLRSAYGMTPDEYRVKWGLPGDYPMAAPNYAKHRSTVAKAIGLGKIGRGKA